MNQVSKLIIIIAVMFVITSKLGITASINSNSLPIDIITVDSYDDAEYMKKEKEKQVIPKNQEVVTPAATAHERVKEFTKQYTGDELEEQKHMEEQFEKYVREKKKSSMFIMLGINEFISGDSIDDAFALGARFEHRNDTFLIALPHIYPQAIIGSKGMTMNLFSYAFMDTEFLKLYLDPIVPFIQWDGSISLASGGSVGIYGKRFGIEFNYKHLWTNPYKDDDDKEYSDFWGLFFVYRY
ncbi:hypothetical protein DEFDS_P013 (plasmid) [Deferribacter desulfuricans SSM1]|uniref:Uncharacterized protein n=1 Tax=Deferribacter desulfuricans (strain DSM 14783 / JCM 11476 / NBRC 101012 / SSM1) TaxID=639282 RepID=D3PEJ9_DEFDS|nr:hypothetical protein [Deferribacter desulfuricans]BAI81641.1 hypothetical protein DEFDS_P013 [Deferribacter desulfuricans SSM1]